MSKDRILDLIAVGGGVVALAFLLRKYIEGTEESPSGSMYLTPALSGKTVTVTLKAKASGTYPITFSGEMNVYDITDRERTTKVAGWPISGTIYGGEEYTVIKTFTGTSGHIYRISASATFKNDYGTDTKHAYTDVSISGEPPSASLSIETNVS